jgi:20S proteasome alpha/beta subunit
MYPKPHTKVFPSPKKRLALRSKAVTIGIGFRCRDGIVLAADQQVTWEDSHKAYECKFRCHFSDGWNVAFTYAGSPVLWKSFNDKFGEAMNLLREPPTMRVIRDMVETILGLFDELKDDPARLNLLCAVIVTGEDHALLRTEGYVIHSVRDYEYVGYGDSSLLRFLGPLITASPPVATADQAGRIVRQAVMMATYLVMKAKTYIDGCGGDTDVLVVRPDGSLTLWSSPEIYKIEQMMLMLEHHMEHVAAHFFDRRFSDDQLAKTLEFMVSRLKSDHIEFQVPVD